MQSVVQSGDSSVGAAITHWMLFAIDRKFAQRVVKMNGKNALGALQELVLCFRKAYDEGLGLTDSVVERIDVLTVSICSPEAVCKTLCSARWSGNEPFSEANMRWWADRLDKNKGRVFRLLCDHSPPFNLSPAPSPAEIAHVRIICEAALVWEESWGDAHFLFRALPLVVSCCTLSESDLSLWFPAMTSPHILLAKVFGEIIKQTSKNHEPGLDNRKDMLILANVMRCAVGRLPGTVTDDPTLFISLVSGSLDLAALYESKLPAKLVAEFGNLLDAAASFAQLHNAHNAHAHNTTIRQWLVKLTKLEDSPLMTSPARAEPLIHAARDGNTIEGLNNVETLSQLDWAE
ncbi:hypothetical protein FB451DRAFT_1392800 [Mycena latifolia]|nr:hypothetical protein FB451DRAFT_1392800 [Mycena latifolia]